MKKHKKDEKRKTSQFNIEMLWFVAVDATLCCCWWRDASVPYYHHYWIDWQNKPNYWVPIWSITKSTHSGGKCVKCRSCLQMDWYPSIKHEMEKSILYVFGCCCCCCKENGKRFVHQVSFDRRMKRKKTQNAIKYNHKSILESIYYKYDVFVVGWMVSLVPLYMWLWVFFWRVCKSNVCIYHISATFKWAQTHRRQYNVNSGS